MGPSGGRTRSRPATERWPSWTKEGWQSCFCHPSFACRPRELQTTTHQGSTSDFLRLTALESSLSLPIEARIPAGSPTDVRARSPRQVLEQLLTSAAAGKRRYVMFSGGRDSSAILAAAVHAARSSGDDDPIPVILRYPGDPAAEETDWQELVLKHLGLKNQRVVEIRTEERLLGVPATRAMLRHGVVWPTALQLRDASYAELAPGVLITGEGGDYLFTPHRITPLRNLLLRPHIPNRAELRNAANGAFPGRLDRIPPWVSPWLRGHAVEAYRDAITRLRRTPLSWREHTLRIYDAPADVVVWHNHPLVVREYGLEPLNPFLHPSFVSALARAGGFLGYADRTHAMRVLFHDLLPDEILRRESKAAFNSSRWGETEREFAHDWDGSGVDPEFIDAETLRQAWLSNQHPPGADYQIQLAWARSQGIDTPLAPD